MSIPKLSPQEARKQMILKMSYYMKNAQNEWHSIQELKNKFMFNTGASTFKTDEYFNLCVSQMPIEIDEISKLFQYTKEETKPKAETKPLIP